MIKKATPVYPRADADAYFRVGARMFFRDRADAGRKLAAALKKFKEADVLILGIPRGGVLVAAEAARELAAPMDLVIPRKIGAPGNPELAIGAVVGKDLVFLDENTISLLRVPREYIDSQVEKELLEIDRRRRLYLGWRRSPKTGNKTLLIIDDGLATGYTALAAIRAARKMKAEKIVLAVPVAPAKTVAELSGEVEELVCLSTPEPFFAVGRFYEEFHQVGDDEVVAELKALPAAEG